MRSHLIKLPQDCLRHEYGESSTIKIKAAFDTSTGKYINYESQPFPREITDIKVAHLELQIDESISNHMALQEEAELFLWDRYMNLLLQIKCRKMAT